MKVKAVLKVIRRTEYALNVEMDKSRFDRIKKDLQSQERQVRRNAELELNGMIRPDHWLDDDLSEIDEFEEIY